MRPQFFRKIALIVLACAATTSVARAATRGWQPGESSVKEAQNRLATGFNHSCVALYEGTVRCWGNNVLGQLGNNTTVNSTVPVIVQRTTLGPFVPASPLDSVIAVAAGTAFTCALTAEGKVFCWGRNESGQLGNLSNTNRTRAVQVFGLTGVVRIVAGSLHACALISDGTVKCWGNNASGRLGTGTTTNSFLALGVSGLTGATEIAAGSAHTCARLSDGTVRCWGDNQFGQLGTGNNTGSPTPVAVTNLAGAFAITAGGEHTCAITPNGVTQCWGRNTDGQLGNGDFTSRTTPVTAIQTNIGSIRAGRLHTCAVTAGGLAKCWGRNAAGQLGNGNTIVQPVPAGVNGLSLIIAAAAGGDHSCAMKADGTVSCWGEGGSGQLGNGGTLDFTVPVTVTGIGGGISAKTVTAGTEHTCALRSNGTVSCWGHNVGLLLGNGNPAPTIAVPTAVSGLTGVTALSAGEQHTCALIADGTLKCWGRNFFGQIGNGTGTDQPTPVPIAGLADIVAVSAGSRHTCALTVAGSAFCWGANSAGQLAISGDTQNRRSPVLAGGLTKVAGLAAGSQHNCAWRTDGSLFCWGSGAFGLMGNGTVSNVNTVPVNVPGIPRTASVAAGGFHACAIDDGGVARCWGLNDSGK